MTHSGSGTSFGFRTGGEMETWQSTDFGQSWTKVRTITRDSPRKHGYARNVFGGTDPFFTRLPNGQVELEFTASQPFDSDTPRFYRLKISAL